MLRLLLLLLWFISSGGVLFCQIADDFSDGNFTVNPSWVGNMGHFVVNASNELQLNAPDAGTSALAVQGNIPDSAVWLLDLRLEFAPSASNLLRVYLLADAPDLVQTRGYYLEIGENGTADALRFYRQDSLGSSVLLSTGLPGFVANDPVDIRLRVRRTSAGAWIIEAAPMAGPFQLQGTTTDAMYSGGLSQYFGVYCMYTATRKDKFFFDNVSIQPLIPDTEPPVLLTVQAAGSTEVEAVFNEDLQPSAALDPAHYLLVGVGAPETVQFSGGSQQALRLQFASPLTTGSYVLQTDQIADTVGNVSGVQSASFDYLEIGVAMEFDLLINEIMADPTPSVGLPEVEWLELYNPSAKVIDLKTLRLSDGGTPQPLPDKLLFPDSFIVLSTTAGAAALLPFASQATAMPGFPSLNNDADLLELRNQTGELIDQVNYSASWHANTDKRNGGWSLERINPTLPCLGAENWQSCPVLPGGTPGWVNTSLQTTPDTEMPRLLTAFPEDAVTLRIKFSEGLDRDAATDLDGYQIEPIRTIAAAEVIATDWSSILLHLAEPLEKGIVYTVTTSQILQDCSGNSVSGLDTVYVGLPEVPAPRDLVINELLFNPATGGADFIELFNRSNKIFDLQDFYLANFADGADVEPIGLKRLFLPGAYLVFTPDAVDIESRFSQVQPERLFEVSLPAFPDDAGNATIYWAKDGVVVTLDSVDYQADWHNALLSSGDREGVSLERIRAGGSSNDPDNWTSAARTISGSGTPTRQNSQHLAALVGSDLVTLNPARLSPDGDGYEDFLNIQYNLPGFGYAASFTIFDAQGLPVRRLARQELIGTTGALRWDGDLDDGTLARPGIYILFLEIFSPQGAVRQEKKTFAVVRRF